MGGIAVSKVRSGFLAGRGIHYTGGGLCIADRYYLNRDSIERYEVTGETVSKKRFPPETVYLVSLWWTTGEVSYAKLSAEKLSVLNDVMRAPMQVKPKSSDRAADWVVNDVAELTPAVLREHGISVVATDMDNTITEFRGKRLSPRAESWLCDLADAGIQVIVVSNAKHDRVARFCGQYGLPFVPRAGKPAPDGLLRAITTCGATPSQALMIGDRVSTDVVAGNRAGVRVAIVEPVSRNPWFRLVRRVDRPDA
ncbi:MAG: YqeG family HAD IIIA-type phosphatase [Promicromonosporaceae bacterium]|nr:YqeG family HAD IIIA-type phosphatase [Promicromonosporaceae bacterium]